MGMTRESLANDMLTSIQAYPEWFEPVCRRAGRGHSRIRRSDRGKLLTYFQNNDS